MVIIDIVGPLSWLALAVERLHHGVRVSCGICALDASEPCRPGKHCCCVQAAVAMPGQKLPSISKTQFAKLCGLALGRYRVRTNEMANRRPCFRRGKKIERCLPRRDALSGRSAEIARGWTKAATTRPPLASAGRSGGGASADDRHGVWPPQPSAAQRACGDLEALA